MNHEVYHELRALAAHAAETSISSDATKQGALEVLEDVEVSDALWHASEDAMGDSATDGDIHVQLQDDAAPVAYDFVWLATGGNLDLALVPLLASLLEQRPIPTAGGLPLFQADLAWDAGCPLYVMGAFAMLQLGADALNLAGARSGGVAVARALIAARQRDAAGP